MKKKTRKSVEIAVTERREAVITASPELLVELCKDRGCMGRMARVVRDAIPDDAKYERCVYDEMTNQVLIVVSSQQFGVVPDGNVRPKLPPTQFTVVYEADDAT